MFYRFLFRFDQQIADEVRLEGCAHCGGQLHVACYPRKPRGCALDELCKIRLSFCCASDGCRRRCTPPSVRFQGDYPDEDGNQILDRTTLTPLENGDARQLIEISRDRGDEWLATFDATYARK